MRGFDFPIRARALTGFDLLVAAHGGDPSTMLAQAGLSRTLLEKPEATLSLKKLAHLLEDAATALALPDLGLRLSEYQDINVLGPVALIGMHSATFGESAAGIGRHLTYHTPGAQLAIADDADPDYIQLRYELQLGADTPRRQIMELAYAIAYKFIRLIVPVDSLSAQISFRHVRGTSAGVYRRYFDCPVRFDSVHDAIRLPRRVLSAPLDARNADLRAAAERYVANIEKRFPLDIARQVQTLAAAQLGDGQATIDRIAAQLGLSRRTLQRRLAEQGVLFGDIVDALRQTRAAEYLPLHAIPLGQIGALLGYSEQSAFIGACKRRFGKTPREVRAGAGKVPKKATRRRT